MMTAFSSQVSPRPRMHPIVRSNNTNSVLPQRAPRRVSYAHTLVLCALTVSSIAAPVAAQDEATPVGNSENKVSSSSPTNEAKAPDATGSESKTAVDAIQPLSPPRKPIYVRAGKSISISTSSKQIRVTNDVNLAKEQVSEFQDSPEAHFILAVALTRTSHVEEALQEVRRARKLSFAKGGPTYFDKMISEYEAVLKDDPDDNEVRYHLAWAYYMKAYVLTKYSRQVLAQVPATPPSTVTQAKPANEAIPTPPETKWHQDWVTSSANGNQPDAANVDASASAEKADEDDERPSGKGRIPSMEYAWKNASPAVIPQIKKYYQMALWKLDGLLKRDPSDLWATLYRAHLSAEYSGDIDSAMKVWQSCQMKYPSNPAPYFFLGEGYLKKGNLRESLSNVSKAIALRTLGN